MQPQHSFKSKEEILGAKLAIRKFTPVVYFPLLFLIFLPILSTHENMVEGMGRIALNLST